MHAAKILYFAIFFKKRKPKIFPTAYKHVSISCTVFLDLLTLLMLFHVKSSCFLCLFSRRVHSNLKIFKLEPEITLCCNEYFLQRFSKLPPAAHINDYVLRLSRVKHLQFLESTSTQYLNATRYLRHSKFIKKYMGVMMRNVCLLPTRGIWDKSEEIALNNSAIFLQSLWHDLSFSWEIA